MTPPHKGAVIERRASDHGKREDGVLENDGLGGSPETLVGQRRETLSGKEAPRGQTQEAIGEAVPLQERLIVAPCPGRFRPGERPASSMGEYILEGQEVGCIISSDRETVPVKSAFSGWILGYLVPEGSPVRAAEPVAWLRPH